MEWFRAYHDVINDHKIQGLAIEMRWRWFEMLCLCSMNAPRGTLPGLDEVAFKLRMNATEASAVLQTLIDVGLIDKSVGSRKLRIHHWEKWQRDSDDVATRVKRFRKRKCNVTVTPPDSDTEEIRKETGKENPPPTFEINTFEWKKQQCIDQATRHWGASNGDVIVGELLRTFHPDIVMDAMDCCFEKFKHEFKPAYLRKCCEGKFRDHECKNGKM